MLWYSGFYPDMLCSPSLTLSMVVLVSFDEDDSIPISILQFRLLPSVALNKLCNSSTFQTVENQFVFPEFEHVTQFIAVL